MNKKNNLPTCNCGEEHHFYRCECGCDDFKFNAKKQLVCCGCHLFHPVSAVIAMLKQAVH